jgi:parallel beta-helix repeat protein
MYSIPGIYNVLDTAFAGGMIPAGPTTQNSNALQSAIDTAQKDPYGGIVLIPTVGAAGQQGAYGLATGVNIPNLDGAQPLLICGTGGGTTLLMQTPNLTLFNVTSNSGITFQDLTISYSKAPDEAFPLGTAFSFTGGAGYNLVRITVNDCQYPFFFSGTTQAYLFQCLVSYNQFPADPLTVVQVEGGAKDTWIEQCLFKFNADPTSGQTQVGISVGQSSFTRVISTQIESFLLGILLGGGNTGTAIAATFTNARVATMPTGLNVKLQPGSYDAKFIGCHFQTSETTPFEAQCIVIDPGTSGNNSIDTVIFNTCSSRASQDYGLEIRGGQNIQIIGGTFSGNNPQNASSAGIAVTGPALRVQMDGVNCTPIADPTGKAFGPQAYGIYILNGSDIQITNANCSGNGTSAKTGAGIYINGTGVSGIQIRGAACSTPADGSNVYQAYGILVEQASDVIISSCSAAGNLQYGLYLVSVNNVTVKGCNLFGNSTGGVYLSGGSGSSQSQNVFIRDCNITGYSTTQTITFAGTIRAAEVTDCSGYNDRAVPVLTSAPANGFVFYGGTSWGYYGPVAFYVEGGTGTSVTIDSNPTGLGSGGFTLQPGESATLFYNIIVPAPTFLMVGS